MHHPSRLRRAAIAAAGAALLLLGAAAADAAGSGGPDDTDAARTAAGRPVADSPATVTPVVAPGYDLEFHSVAPCRILDTRQVGGKLSAGSRVFDATLASYAVQGGKAASCGIPDFATAVQLNLGAISQDGKTSDIRGWATGTAEPTASLVNYNPAGPVANMVTMQVNASGQFTLKTPGSAHVFADVAGYYSKPAYALVLPGGGVAFGIGSGVQSAARTSTGEYTVVFDRNIANCAVNVSPVLGGTNIVGADQTGPDDTVFVHLNSATGTPVDAFFDIAMTC